MDTQQGTPAWFNARKGKLTASNFGAAAGVNPYSSRRKALKRELGQEVFTGNEACRWGTTNERNAIKDYMVRTGNVVRSKGSYTHPTLPWLGGSPDGLVGTEGIIEVKCPFAKMVPHTVIPQHYYCQVNGLLEILDRKWCDFISWTPSEMKIYRVYRDEACWDYLLERYSVFFACMARGCVEIPNMRKGEKDEVSERITQSDAHTRYNYWSHLEPAQLQGVWDSPPNDPYLQISDDFSEEEVNGTSPIRKVRRSNPSSPKSDAT